MSEEGVVNSEKTVEFSPRWVAFNSESVEILQKQVEENDPSFIGKYRVSDRAIQYPSPEGKIIPLMDSHNDLLSAINTMEAINSGKGDYGLLITGLTIGGNGYLLFSVANGFDPEEVLNYRDVLIGKANNIIKNTGGSKMIPESPAIKK